MASVRKLVSPVAVVVAILSFAALTVLSYAMSADREVGPARPAEVRADEPVGLIADQIGEGTANDQAGTVATGFESAVDHNAAGPNTVSSHIYVGNMHWATGGGESFMTIGSPNIPAIPPDFFYPGSDPFTGTIQFNETNKNFEDDAIDLVAGTVIRPYGDPPDPTAPNGAVQTMPIEIVALSLTSVSPITVTDGPQNTLWNVRVTLSDSPSPQGSMTATKTHDNGGTYDCNLPVLPKLTFTRLGSGEVRVVDIAEGGAPLLFSSTNNHYVYRVDRRLLVRDTVVPTFTPGVREVTPGDPSSQVIAPSTLFDPLANTQHTVEPPRPPDPHATPSGNSSFATFGSPDIPPIPAGFFRPGSNAFIGTVPMRGAARNVDSADYVPWRKYRNASTFVLRSGDPVSPTDPNGQQGTVAIEIVSLNLVSSNPITVIGGGPATQWHMHVDLSANAAPQGSLTATKTHPNGGTFDAALFVQPRFTFIQIGEPSNVRVLDTGLQGIQALNFTSTGNHFVFDVNDALGVVTPHDGRFVAGVREMTPGNPASQVTVIGTFNDPGAQTQHQMEPPKEPDPHGTRGGGPGQSSVGFGVGNNPPIPADFFFPGSAPFSGNVALMGSLSNPFGDDFPIMFAGNSSTLIVRPGPPVSPSAPNGTMGTVPIEIVALSLESVNPILDSGGTAWEMEVTLSIVPAPPGSLTATKTHANGGTFSATLLVRPRFTFSQVANENEVRILDTGLEGMLPINFNASGGQFVFNLNPQLGTTAPYDGTFVPGVQELTPGNPASQRFVQTLFDDPPGPTRHVVDPPTPPDPHATPRGFSFNGFGFGTTPPIPADFFGPGSDPFVGSIQWQGHRLDQDTLGNSSVLVRRSGMPVSPQAPNGAQGTVEIELVALSLVSISPINVTYNAGTSTERWLVELSGGPVDNQPGQLTATKSHPNGGTFDAFLPVNPVFTFFKVQPQPEPPAPVIVRVLDSELMGFPPAQLQASGVPFVHVVNPALNLLSPSRGTFVPGVRENTPGSLSSQSTEFANFNDPVSPVQHTVKPPVPEPPPDPHATAQGPGPSSVVFGGGSQPPIPADFFGPGSDPFTGTVQLEGLPPDPANDISTLIQRSGHPLAPTALNGAIGEVEIEIVELSLASINPILVTFNGGMNLQAWGVRVGLSAVTPSQGALIATKTHPNGGTFDTFLFVQPKFTFTKLLNQSMVRVLDTGGEGIPPILFQSSGTPWVHVANVDLGIIAPSNGNFVPGVEEVEPGNMDSQVPVPMEEFDPNGPTRHTVRPPRPSPACACDADVDGNTFVNFIDLALIVDCLNGVPSCDPDSDVNCDGTIDHADLGVAVHQFRMMPGDGCDVPTGACCQANGTCLHEQQFMCAGDPLFPQYAGIYQGDGTTCSPNPCGGPPPEPGGDDLCVGGSMAGQVCSKDGDCPGGLCATKNRYLSFTAPPSSVALGTPRAVQMTVTASPQFPSIVGDVWWATSPLTISNPPPSGATVSGSALECTGTPFMQVWSGTIYCFGAVVVPNATYEIRLCDSVSGPCDPPIVIETVEKYGDVLAPFGGISQPNFIDIDGVVQSFRGLSTAPPIVRSDLVPAVPNHTANFVDIEAAVLGFRGFPYPNTPPECP